VLHRPHRRLRHHAPAAAPHPALADITLPAGTTPACCGTAYRAIFGRRTRNAKYLQRRTAGSISSLNHSFAPLPSARSSTATTPSSITRPNQQQATRTDG